MATNKRVMNEKTRNQACMHAYHTLLRIKYFILAENQTRLKQTSPHCNDTNFSTRALIIIHNSKGGDKTTPCFAGRKQNVYYCARIICARLSMCYICSLIT